VVPFVPANFWLARDSEVEAHDHLRAQQLRNKTCDLRPVTRPDAVQEAQRESVVRKTVEQGIFERGVEEQLIWARRNGKPLINPR